MDGVAKLALLSETFGWESIQRLLRDQIRSRMEKFRQELMRAAPE